MISVDGEQDGGEYTTLPNAVGDDQNKIAVQMLQSVQETVKQ